ncbi:MAG: TonB-dependent receptor plug domain-containing protein [Desulfobacterales bacterium]
MKSRIICLACLLGMFLPAAVLGQKEAGKDENIARLDEMVVTGQRHEEPVRKIDTNATVLDEQDIERSSAKDLGDLLAEENIGHIYKTPGNQTSIGIRGFRGDSMGSDLDSKVLVLLDGRRAGTSNVAKIMTENIERVEIIRGPGSVQYGSAAIGGVVNVITKQGKDDPSFFAEGALGSFGYQESSAGFSGRSGGFDFSGAASLSTMDDYDTADGEKYKNTGYDEKQNINLNFGYEFMPENRIGIVYTNYDAEGVGSPSSLRWNDPDDYVDNINESIDLIYDGATRDGVFSWKTRYFTGDDEYKFYDMPSQNDNYARNTDFRGAQAQVTWDPGQYTLTSGVDWINYEIKQDAPQKTEFDNPAYFILAKARYFEDRLTLSGGLRYDDYEVKVKKGEGGKEEKDNTSPRIGAAWFVLDSLKLRANYSQGFRMPSARELAGDYDDELLGPHKGNPELDPEKSDTYEVGMDWYYRALDASLTYFYTDFEDKIDTETTDVTTWKNIGDATISGFEGSLAYDVANLWNLEWEIRPFVNFTYLTEYEDEETGEDLPHVSDLLISYGLLVSDYDGFSMRLNVAHTGDQYIEHPTAGEKGKFSVANLTIEKRLADFNRAGDLSLRGEIDNLFDRDYSYTEGYPMPGRNFALSLRYTY